MRRLYTALAAFVLLISAAAPTQAYVNASYYFGPSVLTDEWLTICFETGTPFNNHSNAMSVLHNTWGDIFEDLNFLDEESCANQADAEISVYLTDFGFAQSCEFGGPLGKTDSDLFTWINSERISHAAVELSQDCQNDGVFYWGSSTVPAGKIDALSVIAHEVGHAMGLCHQNGNASTYCAAGTGNGFHDLLDIVGPGNADCGENSQPFEGRRITDISIDDWQGANNQYPNRVTNLNPGIGANADCVS